MKILINDKLIDEDVINKLVERFSCTVQEIEMLFAKITCIEITCIEIPFDLEDVKEATERLQEYAVSVTRIVDDIKELFIEHSRECWHTHHKEGKPCKAKIKPIYWHRIRSFCVQNNYH